MAEPVEQLDLLVGVATDVVIVGQVGDELADAGPKLVGEVRGGRTDEGVDVVASGAVRLAHRGEA